MSAEIIDGKQVAADMRAEMKQEVAEHKPGDWWFGMWQPDQIDGKHFGDADPEMLRSNHDAWLLKPGAAWHGFGGFGIL